MKVDFFITIEAVWGDDRVERGGREVDRRRTVFDEKVVRESGVKDFTRLVRDEEVQESGVKDFTRLSRPLKKKNMKQINSAYIESNLVQFLVSRLRSFKAQRS